MTKKDLEKENKFLKLQLKVIGELLKNAHEMDERELMESIGGVKHITECYDENFEFIKAYDLEYNYFNDNMSI